MRVHPSCLLVLGSLVFAASCSRDESPAEEPVTSETTATEVVPATPAEQAALAAGRPDPSNLPEGSEWQEARAGDGTLVAQGYICHGKPVGPWIYYHPDGKVSRQGEYRYGATKHGEWRTFFPDGQLEAISNYEFGKRHGDWTRYHRNGRRSMEGQYFNDKATGLWTTWHANGQRESRGTYNQGRRYGAWKTWNEDGRGRGFVAYLQPTNEAAVLPPHIQARIDEGG